MTIPRDHAKTLKKNVLSKEGGKEKQKGSLVGTSGQAEVREGGGA